MYRTASAGGIPEEFLAGAIVHTIAARQTTKKQQLTEQ